MPVIYSAATKTARMQAVADEIDGGVIVAGGTLEIGTTAFAAVIAIFTLTDPCGTVSGNVLTFDFDPDLSTVGVGGGGTAAVARIKDSDGTIVVSGLTVTATGGGGDIELDNLSIATDQVVNLATGALTHAADPA